MDHTREGFTTSRRRRIPRINEYGLGSEPTQPTLTQRTLAAAESEPSGSQPTNTAIDVITAGLHHTGTLLGTNPLTEEGPTNLMANIQEHIEAGENVPLFEPPRGANYPAPQVNVATTTTSTNEGRGTLKGSPPKEFDGTRSESETFADDFVIYWKINRANSVMKEPYSRVLMALSFMKGTKVRDWTRENHGLGDPHGPPGRVATGTGAGRKFPTLQKPSPVGVG